MFLTETGLAKVFQRVRSFVASQLNSKASVIHTHTSSDITDFPTIPTKTSELTNNSGYITKNDVYNLIYPIGSIYLSVNSVDPSTLFGGTWEKIKDKFLLSDGDTYSIGSTGGEASHTLTINEMPTHHHGIQEYKANECGYIPAGHDASSIQVRTDVIGIENQGGVFTDRPSGYYFDSSFIENTGGSQPHNNMPPYLTINVWKRVA